MARRLVNKSAFVRGLPNVSAKEVVAKAKAHGFALSEKYVYNIRAKAKAGGGKGPGRPGRPKGSGRSKVAASVQQRFVDLALEIGLAKAEALLARLRSAIRHAVVA